VTDANPNGVSPPEIALDPDFASNLQLRRESRIRILLAAEALQRLAGENQFVVG
jgi:hypothetical protein